MFKLNLIGTGMIPRGFWLQLLWLIGVGIKNETDDQGSFVMFTISIWKFSVHLTFSFDSK
jgi:hypothetical protein